MPEKTSTGLLRFNLSDEADLAVLIATGLIWRGGPEGVAAATEYLQSHPEAVNSKVPASVLANLQPTVATEPESPDEDVAEGGVEEPTVAPNPKQVRLLGQRIGVLKIEDLVHDDGVTVQEAYGVFEPAQPVIWLDSANGSERMKVTLVHEVLHAVLDTSHQTIPEEEAVVGILAPLLLDFIRNNKATVAYLQES